MGSTVDVVFQLLVVVLCAYAITARWGLPACRALDRRFRIVERLPLRKPKLIAQPALLPSLFVQEAPRVAQQPPAPQSVPDPVIPQEIEPEEDDEEEDNDDEGNDNPDDIYDGVDPEEEEEVEATASTPLPQAVYVAARPTHLNVDTRGVKASQANNRINAWVSWMSRVFRKAIHLIVIGQSGAGKTTALQVFVESLVVQGVPVVVCDPDAAAGDWPGAQVFGAGDDFKSITNALRAVQTMAKERREARAQGQREFDEFWFIVDEYAEIKDECASAGTIVEGGLRRWRKLNMHLVIGIQDTQAKTMGFERRTSLLQNARIVRIRISADDVRTAHTEEEPAIIIPELIPQRGPTPEEALSGQVALTFVMPNPDNDEGEGEDDGLSLEGKDAQIADMLRESASYAEIAAELRVATTRISRVKRDLGIS